MRNRDLLLAAAALTACGSRTGLASLGFPGEPLDGAVSDGPARTDAEDAVPPLDASRADAADAADRDAPSPCGAPWVLFGLTLSTEGGAGQTNRIVAKRADGSEFHVLSLVAPEVDPNQIENPSVSPDGTRLLYTDSSLSRLFVYDFTSSANLRLDTGGGVGFGSIAPDGRWVVFGDGTKLWLVRATGSAGDQHLLVSVPQPNAAGTPVFTKDSRSVVFSESGAVMSIHVNGAGTTTLLTESPGLFAQPALSPDYEDLAAVVSCGATIALRAYPFDSLPAPCESGRIIATFGDTTANSPSWGPTGLIAFVQVPDVFVVSAEGGTPTNLTADVTADGGMATSPTWAPACTQLP